MRRRLSEEDKGRPMESGKLIRPLFEGPLDVVGDVHGEIDALTALLGQLGYDPQGVHPDGRRLVFVGDLCDRGPDSPAVIGLVRRLVETGPRNASSATTSSTCCAGRSTATTGTTRAITRSTRRRSARRRG